MISLKVLSGNNHLSAFFNVAASCFIEVTNKEFNTVVLKECCYLSSLCLVAYRAFTEVFHCSLSAAIILVSSHDLHPASLHSFSTEEMQICQIITHFIQRHSSHHNIVSLSLSVICKIEINPKNMLTCILFFANQIHDLMQEFGFST